MITVLTMAFAQYLRTPFEDFTAKYILARGIFQLLDNLDKEDIVELKEIERYTSPEVRVSLYKLDRAVNPTKGEFKTVAKKFEFNMDYENNPGKITLTDDEIQNILCVAIRRIHEIIMKVMKSYKVEQSMDGMDGEESDENLKEMFGDDGGTSSIKKE